MILETLGAFGGLVVAVSIAFGLYFSGKRSNREEAARWRDQYEAEHVRAERQAVSITEQHSSILERDETVERMRTKLDRLDEERKEFVGSKAYDAILAQSAELRQLNETLTELADWMKRKDEC